MPNEHRMPGSFEDRLAVVDALCALPFPERELTPGKSGRWGGPGYHLAVLHESRDFWDDRGVELLEAAELEAEEVLASLAAPLTARWGAPVTVGLWPYLGLDAPYGEGPEAVREPPEPPEPLGFLAGVAGSMRVWRPPSSGRWLALTVGQADPEWPFQLLAAVGENAALPE
ncbi:hypothetical protein [Streptomyces sp. NPDC048172]|uniref:hypothetical protein n=1 Tax=Streptomyces sp. NPDC048172 TaxID=3365505 RepID=UPI00371E1508